MTMHGQYNIRFLNVIFLILLSYLSFLHLWFISVFSASLLETDKRHGSYTIGGCLKATDWDNLTDCSVFSSVLRYLSHFLFSSQTLRLKIHDLVKDILSQKNNTHFWRQINRWTRFCAVFKCITEESEFLLITLQ